MMMLLMMVMVMMQEAVAHYRVYIAMNERGLDRILAAPQSPVGTNFGDVPAETILPYCARAPFRIPAIRVPTSDRLPYKQPSPQWFLRSTEGLRAKPGEEVGDPDLLLSLLYSDSLWIIPPILIASKQHAGVLVHSVSTLSEQTTPTWKNVSDTNFQVTNVQLEDLDLDFQQLGGSITWEPCFRVTLLTFTDLDLDNDELGGTLGWFEHSQSYKVVAYHVFLATDETGSNRFRISNGTGIPQGSNEFDVEPDTTVWLEGSQHATHFCVFQVSFTDLDLDVSQFGGNLTWQQPSLDTALITHYMVYFGLDAAGLDNRYNDTELEELGALSYVEMGEVPYGTNSFQVPAGTVRSSYSHFLVYSRSTLAEASTPAFLSFLGAALNASVTEVNFTDDAAGLHTVQLASLGCGGKVLEPKEVAKFLVVPLSSSSPNRNTILPEQIFKDF
eukprot:s5200_g7.t1